MSDAVLKLNLPGVRERLAAAAERAGRNPSDVTLVAVTKGHRISAVDQALEAGLSDLAENRVEALEARVAARGGAPIRWHMVGRVQRRKAPRLIGICDLVHAVDSVRLGERFSRAAEERGEELRALVQVNVSGEDAKGGFSVAEAQDAVLELSAMAALRVEGLMTMAPHVEDVKVLRATFQGLRELHLDLRSNGYPGRHLSMGMSNDFEIAVEEGSTLVRLGTALFGEREA